MATIKALKFVFSYWRVPAFSIVPIIDIIACYIISVCIWLYYNDIKPVPYLSGEI